MGTLIAFRYPTNLFARLADHTYVACGTLGKAWSCWGGKTGGTELRRGPGSTEHADRIAEPDEKAGITCYLINGVCHQAANRILLPAGFIVEGARGYAVSEALFGTYGRPRGVLGFCRAPFHRHPGVTGDLPECMAGIASIGPGNADEATDPRQRAHIERTLRLYETDVAVTADADSIVRFQLALFELFLVYKLGDDRTEKVLATPHERDELMQLRERIERRRIDLETRFEEDKDVDAFVRGFNALTVEFQVEVERILGRSRYSLLLDLEPGDHVILADPEIVEHAYTRKPGEQAT